MQLKEFRQEILRLINETKKPVKEAEEVYQKLLIVDPKYETPC